MKFDIVIVTYNSKKWMENCINSLENQKDFDLKNLNLYIVDNGSQDGTLEYIEKRGAYLKVKYNLRYIKVIIKKENKK